MHIKTMQSSVLFHGRVCDSPRIFSQHRKSAHSDMSHIFQRQVSSCSHSSETDEQVCNSTNSSRTGPYDANDAEDSIAYRKSGHVWMGSICILLNFLVEMFDQIIIVPQIGLIEDALCRDYYTANLPGLGAQHDCKVTHIQQKLASLRSWKALLDSLAGELPQFSTCSSEPLLRRDPDYTLTQFSWLLSHWV